LPQACGQHEHGRMSRLKPPPPREHARTWPTSDLPFASMILASQHADVWVGMTQPMGNQ
jgi:hypothetical protein